MSGRHDMDTMVDACLAAMEAIKQHGTPEMKVLMRLILLLIGRDLAKADRPKPDGHGKECH